MLDIKFTIPLGCWMALALSGAGLVSAQETSAWARHKPGDLDQIRKMSALIGKDVMNQTNKKVAVLRDVALTPEGDMAYALLGYGGLAGVAETYTAAPFDRLGVRHDEGKWAVNLNIPADDIKKAPAIHSKNYRELTAADWVRASMGSTVIAWAPRRNRGRPPTRNSASTAP